jgi:hypothetical protein
MSNKHFSSGYKIKYIVRGNALLGLRENKPTKSGSFNTGFSKILVCVLVVDQEHGTTKYLNSVCNTTSLKYHTTAS